MMIGYYDGLEDGSSVTGWVWLGENVDPTSVRITVELDSKKIGHGKPDIVRRDVKIAQGVPTGFNISCFEKFSIQDCLSNKFAVKASYGDIRCELKMNDPTRARLQRKLVERESMARRPPILNRNGKDIFEFDPKASVKVATETSISSLNLPVGIISSDGSAYLGKEGSLFLIGGTNDVLRLYDTKPESQEKTDLISEKWKSLFDKRSDILSSKGIDYIQMVIPEKLSIQLDLHDLDICGVSPLLSYLENKLENSPFYFSALPAIYALESFSSAYRSNDTHLNAHGAKAVIVELLKAISPRAAKAVSKIPLDFLAIRNGDLSNRFFGLPILEKCKEPSSSNPLFGANAPKLLKSEDPKAGHQGTARHWSKPDALVQKRVLIFGNSFFDVGSKPNDLSWWCSRIFKECYFLWTPKFEYDLVDEISPDIVIGQTVERFLLNLPRS